MLNIFKKDETDPFAKSEEKQPPDSSVNQKQEQGESTTPSASTKENNPDPSSVKFANAHPNNEAHPKQMNPTEGPVDIGSDRRQVQEQEQVGNTGDVDLKAREGRLDPNAHEDKEIGRAAQL